MLASPSTLLVVLCVSALAFAAGCGTHARTLPFPEARALCEGFLPQVTDAFTCRMDELQAPTRVGGEPSYDATAALEFASSGRLEHFSNLRASGPAADPNVAPAECIVRTLRHLSVPKREDTLSLSILLQYRQSEAFTPAASIQPDGRCALLLPLAAR